MMAMNSRNMLFDIDINFQEYTSFIPYELCYWLPSHIDNFTHTTGMTLLKIMHMRLDQGTFQRGYGLYAPLAHVF